MHPAIKKLALRNLNIVKNDKGLGFWQTKALEAVCNILEKEKPTSASVPKTLIHQSNKAEYWKNFDGTITVIPRNPNRNVDEETSLIRISNDKDGWDFFNYYIRPLYPNKKFYYYYRCPNDGKPYPHGRGNVNKKRGKIVSIY